MEDALPIPVEEANLDYHLLEELEVTDRGPARPRRVARILLIAATRDMVDAFVDAAQRAGLRPTGVDLLPFALVRARTPHGLDPAGEVEAIVDIGADVVSVVVHAGGVPRYVRIIPGIGGDTITAGGPAALRLDLGGRRAHQGLRRAARPRPPRRGPAETVAPRDDGLDHPAQKVIVPPRETLVPGDRHHPGLLPRLDRRATADGPSSRPRVARRAARRLRRPPRRPARAARGAPRTCRVETLDAHPTVAQPPQVRSTGDVSVAGRPGRPVRRSGPMKLAAAPRATRARACRRSTCSRPSAFDLLAVAPAARPLRRRGVALVAAGRALAGPSSTCAITETRKLVAVEQAETGRLNAETRTLLPVKTFVTGVAVAAGDREHHDGPRDLLLARARRHPPRRPRSGASLDRRRGDARGRRPRAAATAGTTGAPAAAAPTVSPCPGPDPFNTKPVIGCMTLSGTAETPVPGRRPGDRAVADADLFVEPFISTTSAADRDASRSAARSGCRRRRTATATRSRKARRGPASEPAHPRRHQDRRRARRSSSSPRSAGCSSSGPRPSTLADARAEIQSTRDQNQVLATQLHALEAQRAELGPTRKVARQLAGKFPPTADQPGLFEEVTAAAVDAGIGADGVTTLAPSAPQVGGADPPPASARRRPPAAPWPARR